MPFNFLKYLFYFRRYEDTTSGQTDRQRYIQIDRQTELKYYIEVYAVSKTFNRYGIEVFESHTALIRLLIALYNR